MAILATHRSLGLGLREARGSHQFGVPRAHLASSIPERSVNRTEVAKLLFFQCLLKLLAAQGIASLDVEGA